MTATAHNPTDTRPSMQPKAASLPPQWFRKLSTVEGRAEFFDDCLQASLWADAPTGTREDVWVWIGGRSLQAQRFAQAWQADPLAIAAMFAEAANALFAQRNEKKQ